MAPMSSQFQFKSKVVDAVGTLDEESSKREVCDSSQNTKVLSTISSPITKYDTVVGRFLILFGFASRMRRVSIPKKENKFSLRTNLV